MNLKKVLLGLITIVILSLHVGCKEEDELEFGPTETSFEAGTVYQATSDGFLLVQYTNGENMGSMTNAYVYSDANEDPTTIIAIASMVPGSVNTPIQKGAYWKVALVPNISSISISWIPVQ
jgi:hypothetical protein